MLIVASLAGIALNLTPLDPIKALYWSAVINGVTAVPLMIVMMLMGSRRKVMGKFTLPWPLKDFRLAGYCGNGHGGRGDVCHLVKSPTTADSSHPPDRPGSTLRRNTYPSAPQQEQAPC